MKALTLAIALSCVSAAACRPDNNTTPATPDAAVTDSRPPYVVVDVGGNPVDPPVTWDPVWHETSPREWPTLPSGTQPPCGVACRIALEDVVEHNDLMEHTHNAASVVDTTNKRLLLADIGSSVTKVIVSDAPEGEGFGGPQLHGTKVLYVRVFGPGRTVLELIDVHTGERKIVYRTTPLRDRDMGIWSTWLNDRYAFWMRDGVGVMSRNLATGAVRILVSGELNCGRHFTTDTGIFCDAAGGKIVFVDQETGALSAVDSAGTALQTDLGYSFDRRQLAWVDYRNQPAGEKESNLRFYRNGGEIYAKDLQTGTVERLTHDFPSSPRQKVGPVAIDGDVVVWFEQPAGEDLNPTEGIDGVYYGARAMVVLDRKTGKRCRAEDFRVAVPLIRGRHIYGYRAGAFADGRMRLVDVDLDDPKIPWTCTDAT